MYTIGEFSRLTQVSARMLHHYDQLGLLRPARLCSLRKKPSKTSVGCGRAGSAGV